MKKLKLVIVCALALSATAAHADCFDLSNSTEGVACLLLGSTFWPTLMSVATAKGEDEKTAYIGALRDDAANYVGSGGNIVAGAVLQDAINQIRAKDGDVKNVSDLEIAREIFRGGN